MIISNGFRLVYQPTTPFWTNWKIDSKAGFSTVPGTVEKFIFSKLVPSWSEPTPTILASCLMMFLNGFRHVYRLPISFWAVLKIVSKAGFSKVPGLSKNSSFPSWSEPTPTIVKSCPMMFLNGFWPAYRLATSFWTDWKLLLKTGFWQHQGYRNIHLFQDAQNRLQPSCLMMFLEWCPTNLPTGNIIFDRLEKATRKLVFRQYRPGLSKNSCFPSCSAPTPTVLASGWWCFWIGSSPYMDWQHHLGTIRKATLKLTHP